MLKLLLITFFLPSILHSTEDIFINTGDECLGVLDENLEKVRLPALVLHNGTILPSRTLDVMYLRNTIYSLKNKILQNQYLSDDGKKRVENSIFVIEEARGISSMYVCPPENDEIYRLCVEVSFLNFIDLSIEKTQQAFAALIMHEYSHIAFDDVNESISRSEELKTKQKEDLIDICKNAYEAAGCQEPLISLENYSCPELVDLEYNLSFKMKERRADLFAATILNFTGINEGLKIYNDISDTLTSMNVEQGSISDSHDSVPDRIKLIWLAQSDKISLNLSNGEIIHSANEEPICTTKLVKMIKQEN